MTGELFALAAMLMFASNITITKIASGKLDLNAGFLIAISVNIGFATLLFGAELLLRKDALHWDPAGFLLFVFAGVFSTYLGRWFLFESIARLGPAKTSAFQVTSPLFSMIIAWAFLGERLSLVAIGAMAVTMYGLLLVGTPPGSLGFGPRTAAGSPRLRDATAIAGRARAIWGSWGRSGLLLGLGSSAAYAVGNVLRGAGVRQWNEAILGALVGALAGIGVHLLLGSGHREVLRKVRHGSRTGVMLFAMSGVITISAQMFLIAGMAQAPVAVVALITLCTPIVVFPLSYFLLGNREAMTARTVAGAALALAGMAIIILR